MGRRVVHPGTDAVRTDKRSAADQEKERELRIRHRADELHASGMPHQMALAVAYGKLDLNEALERMARNDRVEKLIKKHDLSRALATQVALGQADLERVLHRRRLEEHRRDNRDRSVLEEAKAQARPITLALHGQDRVEGVVKEVGPYELVLQADGEERTVHKLQVKYAYEPEAYKVLRKMLTWDKERKESPKEPVERPQDRYACSDKRLFRYLDDKVQVQATLLEGEQIRGQVSWLSRFEFGLSHEGADVVTIFRHALDDIDAI